MATSVRRACVLAAMFAALAGCGDNGGGAGEDGGMDAMQVMMGDAATVDAGTRDGAVDAGAVDARARDGEASDGGMVDGETGDAATGDAAMEDGGVAPGVPGITVSPISGLRTTEAGGTATFTVVLDARPSADVTLALSSSDSSEGAVSPPRLVFTRDDWDAPQTVTVTGVDDDVADGDQPYTVVTAPAASGDVGYAALDAEDVGVTNDDDETPGITVAPTDGLRTTEAGGQATFTVVLDSRPSAGVTIALSSDDPTEGTASPARLVFTVDSWRSPQTVTVTGADDDAADGDQPYRVATAAATSTDTGYSGLDAPDVHLVNDDDETPGITVVPTGGLTTTEAGGQATFTVVLDSRPSAQVEIALSSSDATEGSVSSARLTFTPDDWRAPQTVTITGVDDSVADGNQVYRIISGAATSTDASYAGIDAADVGVTNTDDETPGITVTPLRGLRTTEAGGQAMFTIVLNSEPSADVTIPLWSSDTREVTVFPVMIAFTPLDWRTPHTVTLTGVDDRIADGNRTYTIVTSPAVSADPGYAGLDGPNAGGENVDDDSAGITVTPTAGLVTTEAGGADSFTIVLTSEPIANVRIDLSSSDSTEGSVAPPMMVFTPANWRVPQAVTVTGVDDATTDGDIAYAVITSAPVTADLTYAAIDPADVGVTNRDDDVQVTERVSVDSAGGEGDDSSGITSPAVSTDGRYVAFASSASNLVPGDTNGVLDVFLRDRTAGTTTLVSLADDGTPGDGHSYGPAISADGRFVAFNSGASNLVAGDTNGAYDVFVRDTVTGTTLRASVATGGTQGNGGSADPAISADGRYVAFHSVASNLVAGDTNGGYDVFVRDTLMGTTLRASVGPGGAEGNGWSAEPAISADGRYVSFWSAASNLVAGDMNGTYDIFVRDTLMGTTLRASVGPGGVEANGTSGLTSATPEMSADGRYVVFWSAASNLVAGDTNGWGDIFVRDTLMGTTLRASVGPGGAEGDSASDMPAISADGRYVVFQSDASNLVAGDTNGSWDIFVRDILMGTTVRASVGPGGVEGDAASTSPALSGDGRVVAFLSDATNLVAGDTNGWTDVFVRVW